MDYRIRGGVPGSGREFSNHAPKPQSSGIIPGFYPGFSLLACFRPVSRPWFPMIIPGFYPGSAVGYSQGFARPESLPCGDPPFSLFFFYPRQRYNPRWPVSDKAAAIQHSPAGFRWGGGDTTLASRFPIRAAAIQHSLAGFRWGSCDTTLANWFPMV